MEIPIIQKSTQRQLGDFSENRRLFYCFFNLWRARDQIPDIKSDWPIEMLALGYYGLLLLTAANVTSRYSALDRIREDMKVFLGDSLSMETSTIACTFLRGIEKLRDLTTPFRSLANKSIDELIVDLNLLLLDRDVLQLVQVALHDLEISVPQIEKLKDLDDELRRLVANARERIKSSRAAAIDPELTLWLPSDFWWRK
jgi:hypothetical protein